MRTWIASVAVGFGLLAAASVHAATKQQILQTIAGHTFATKGYQISYAADGSFKTTDGRSGFYDVSTDTLVFIVKGDRYPFTFRPTAKGYEMTNRKTGQVRVYVRVD